MVDTEIICIFAAINLYFYHTMKKKGAMLDFAAEREAALMSAFCALAAQRRYVQVHSLCRELVKMPASRFYVSEERARDVIGAMVRGKDVLSGMRQCKRRMFQEIYSRFAAIREREPARSMIDILSEIIYSPAPEYYMEPSNATYLIYHHKRKNVVRG